jgi:hypothetical protein
LPLLPGAGQRSGRASSARRARAFRSTLPGDGTVVDTDEFVLEVGVGGNGDGDGPDGVGASVVERAEGAACRPVLESINATGEVNVLCIIIISEICNNKIDKFTHLPKRS